MRGSDGLCNLVGISRPGGLPSVTSWAKPTEGKTFSVHYVLKHNSTNFLPRIQRCKSNDFPRKIESAFILGNIANEFPKLNEWASRGRCQAIRDRFHHRPSTGGLSGGPAHAKLSITFPCSRNLPSSHTSHTHCPSMADLRRPSTRGGQVSRQTCMVSTGRQTDRREKREERKRPRSARSADPPWVAAFAASLRLSAGFLPGTIECLSPAATRDFSSHDRRRAAETASTLCDPSCRRPISRGPRGGPPSIWERVRLSPLHSNLAACVLPFPPIPGTVVRHSR